MGTTTYVITFLQLSALLFALDHFPENTPKRWDAVSLYVELSSSMPAPASGQNELDYLTMEIALAMEEEAGKSAKRAKILFSGSPAQCKDIASIANSSYPHIGETLKNRYKPLLSNPDRKCPLKPLILTPPLTQCCGVKLSLRNRPSFPTVYTSNGTFVAAAYHGQCPKCKTTYYPSYYEAGDRATGSQMFYDLSTIKVFMISTQTGFEIEYLQQVGNQLSICSSTFQSMADLYTANNARVDTARLADLQVYAKCRSTPWALNPQRREEGWFLYNLVQFFHSRQQQDRNFFTKLINERKDLEPLCHQACEIVAQETPKWIHHKCTTPGCKERFAVIDGNEKVTRTMCAAPCSKVRLPTCGMSVMSCCPNTPSLGGGKVRGSKYCKTHAYLTANQSCSSSTSASDPLIDLSTDPANHQFNNFAPHDIGRLDLDKEDAADGCRKPGSITKYYDRTAGIAAIVRPCGVVVNITEMFTSESLTQMYFFLIFTFGHGQNIEQLRYLGYDRSCGLHPFLVNLAKKNVTFAKYLLDHVKFLVDRFHIKGHIARCCQPALDNPECKYHPDLSSFNEISSANTECAEQAFRWLNKLKYSARQLSRYKFNFFLYVLVDMHNTLREYSLGSQQKLITAQ